VLQTDQLDQIFGQLVRQLAVGDVVEQKLEQGIVVRCRLGAASLIAFSISSMPTAPTIAASASLLSPRDCLIAVPIAVGSIVLRSYASVWPPRKWRQM